MIKRIAAAAQIRADVLETAKRYVLKDRNATHGEPEDNFGRIAELWTAYKRVPINATDVAVMMTLVKVARIAQSPEHRDSWIDLAGYAACGAGIALRPPEDENPCIPATKDTQNLDYNEVVKSLMKENVERLPDKATRK